MNDVEARVAAAKHKVASGPVAGIPHGQRPIVRCRNQDGGDDRRSSVQSREVLRGSTLDYRSNAGH
jgi:hypothetical protein